MSADKRKKCFIITPIGDDGTEIRRHIDGIIDAALTPVIEEQFGYELEVAHRIDAPGNISKQVIMSIYDCDLAIANLTGNNPNVMYELALRHCFGTAVIVIAEVGTIIPADIIGERTIFYVNDAQGVIELKNKLKNMVEKIQEIDDIKQSGPVYDALKEELDKDNVIEKISASENADAFSMIMNKLDVLQKEIRRTGRSFNDKRTSIKRIMALEEILTITCESDDLNKLLDVMKFEVCPLLDKMNVKHRWNISESNSVRLVIQAIDIDQLKMVEDGIIDGLKRSGVLGFKISRETRDVNDIF